MDKPTLHVLIQMTVAPGRQEEAMAMALRFTAEFRRQAGCLRMEVLADETDPCSLVVLEEWEDGEELAAHLQARPMDEVMRRAAPLLTGPPRVSTYRRVAQRAERLPEGILEAEASIRLVEDLDHDGAREAVLELCVTGAVASPPGGCT